MECFHRWSANDRPASVIHNAQHQQAEAAVAHQSQGQPQQPRSASAALPSLDDTTAPAPHRNPLQCVECGIWKMGEEAMEVHINLEHLNWLPFSCRICGEQRPSADQMREHVFSRHKNVIDADLYLYRDNPVSARASRGMMEKVRANDKQANGSNSPNRAHNNLNNGSNAPTPVPTVNVGAMNASLFSNFDENEQQNAHRAPSLLTDGLSRRQRIANNDNLLSSAATNLQAPAQRSAFSQDNNSMVTGSPLTAIRTIKAEVLSDHEMQYAGQLSSEASSTSSNREHEAAESLRLLQTAASSQSALNARRLSANQPSRVGPSPERRPRTLEAVVRNLEQQHHQPNADQTLRNHQNSEVLRALQSRAPPILAPSAIDLAAQVEQQPLRNPNMIRSSRSTAASPAQNAFAQNEMRQQQPFSAIRRALNQSSPGISQQPVPVIASPMQNAIRMRVPPPTEVDWQSPRGNLDDFENPPRLIMRIPTNTLASLDAPRSSHVSQIQSMQNASATPSRCEAPEVTHTSTADMPILQSIHEGPATERQAVSNDDPNVPQSTSQVYRTEEQKRIMLLQHKAILNRITKRKKKRITTKLSARKTHRIKPQVQIELLDNVQPHGQQRIKKVPRKKPKSTTSSSVYVELNMEREQSPELSRFEPSRASVAKDDGKQKKNRLLKELEPFPPVPQPEVPVDEPRKTRRSDAPHSSAAKDALSGAESDGGQIPLNEEVEGNIRMKLLQNRFKVPLRKRKVLLSETSSELGEQNLKLNQRKRPERAKSKDSDRSNRSSIPSPTRSEVTCPTIRNAHAAVTAVIDSLGNERRQSMPLKKRPVKMMPDLHSESPERRPGCSVNVFQALSSSEPSPLSVADNVQSESTSSTAAAAKRRVPLFYRPTRCNACNKTFKPSGASSHVYFHMARDYNILRFRCMHLNCLAEYRRRDQMERHMVLEHGGADRTKMHDRALELVGTYERVCRDVMGSVPIQYAKRPNYNPLIQTYKKRRTKKTLRGIVAKYSKSLISPPTSTDLLPPPASQNAAIALDGGEQSVVVVKRGRGRPKGSFKKLAPPPPPPAEVNAVKIEETESTPESAADKRRLRYSQRMIRLKSGKTEMANQGANNGPKGEQVVLMIS